MSRVLPASTLTNISSTQCIYVCFLQHRLVPYTVLTGFRLLRSLYESCCGLLYYTCIENGIAESNVNCTSYEEPRSKRNRNSPRTVQDFQYTKPRRKHWLSPSPLAFTSTFALKILPISEHSKSQEVQTTNEDRKTWTKLRQTL